MMNEAGDDSTANKQQLQLAASSFKKAVSIDSMDAGSYINLGVVYYRLKQFKQSVLYSQKAISINPHDTLPYANLGDAYFALKDYDKAGDALKTTIEWKDATAAHFKRYGVANFNLKRYNEAIIGFKKGLQKFPDDTEMAANLGSAYGSAANYAKAAETFEAIYTKDPSNMNALRLTIISYEQAGNKEKVAQYGPLLK
jgi:tetratricopeptide (TPR) repeat protein